MDHLPWRHENRERPRVKCLCPDLQDDDVYTAIEEFDAWPVIHGWTLDDDCTAHEAAVVCQKWIFFGLVRLLVEGTGKQFSVKDFVIGEESLYLNTAGLEETLKRCNYTNALFKALECSYAWMLGWVKLLDSKEDDGICGWSADSYQVFWSTALLMEGCVNRGGTRGEAWVGDQAANLVHRLASELHANKFGPQLNETQSWICPALLSRRPMSLYETWTLFACHPSNCIHPSVLRISHQSCSVQQCTASGVPGQQFDKQHDWDCLQHEPCHVINIDNIALNGIVAKHAIPLVRSRLHVNALHVDIVDGSNIEDFVAISHVWSGGLGNPYGNDMYECQLRYLHGVVSYPAKTAGTKYYWLDTLCIPVNDVLLRQKAIDEMARIYASARKVVVIDPVLRYTNLQDYTHQLSTALILASPWMGRSWTLQESALAVELDFCFGDRQVSHRTSRGCSQALANGQFTVLWSRDVDMVDKVSWSANLSASEKLWSVWQELCRRNSTKIEDLAAIISIFIDRSAGDVLAIRNEGAELDAVHVQKRIHALLRSTQSMPSGLLFAPAYDQADVWCPLLPSTTNRADPQSEGSLDFTEEGFLQTNDLRSLFLLRSIGPLPSSGSFRVKDRLGGACFEIVFPDTADLLVEPEISDGLLILPSWAVKEANTRNSLRLFTGLMFSMQPGTTDAELARFKRVFQWRLVHDVQETAEGSSSKIHEHAVAAFPPNYNSRSRDEYRLTMDMGIRDWEILSWSRTASYPFIQQSVKAARSLDMMQYLSNFLPIVFGMYVFMWLVFLCLRPVLPGLPEMCSRGEIWVRFICVLCIFALGVYGQISCGRYQIRYLMRTKQTNLQRIWALTFSKESTTREKTRCFDLGIYRVARVASFNLILVLTLWVLGQLLNFPAWPEDGKTDDSSTPFRLLHWLFLDPFYNLGLGLISDFDAATSFPDVLKRAGKAVGVLCAFDAGIRSMILFIYVWKCIEAKKNFDGHLYEPQHSRDLWGNRFVMTVLGGAGVALLQLQGWYFFAIAMPWTGSDSAVLMSLGSTCVIASLGCALFIYYYFWRQSAVCM